MGDPAKILTVFGILLILFAAFAGCSNSSGTTQTTTTTTAGGAGTAMFSAGDIVGSSSGSSSTAFLIIGYDPASDTYTRAFIHKNTDGSWGYRTNADTQTFDRASMERLYPNVLGHVSVSSVPTSAPTIVTTATVATVATARVTTASPNTTSSAGKITIHNTDPDTANQGDSVAVTITGTNFKDGASVKLKHSGATDIGGTDVNWKSSTSLTCTFDIPEDATPATYDVVVTNPDGTSGTYANWFEIHPAPVTNPTITSVSPTLGYQGNSISMTIIGTKFKDGATVSLTKSGQDDIVAYDVTVSSATKITCSIDIPSDAAVGSWAVVVTNTGDLSGKLTAAFAIHKTS